MATSSNSNPTGPVGSTGSSSSLGAIGNTGPRCNTGVGYTAGSTISGSTIYSQGSVTSGGNHSFVYSGSGPNRGDIRIDNTLGAILAYNGTNWVTIAGLDMTDRLEMIKSILDEFYPEAHFDLTMRGLL